MSAPSRTHTGPTFHPEAVDLDRYLTDLGELVALDSGSYSPAGVNRVADWLTPRLTAVGFRVERVPVTAEHGPVGDVLLARRAGDLPPEQGGRRVLLAGHMDTVFENGTAARRPFHRSGRFAHGPGVSDDKGGLLAGLTALELLHAHGAANYAELVLLATPDEEIGSPASRPVTEAVTAGMHHALALECARENGDLVIARKGVSDFRLTVTGRAAHAGIEPQRGANAALAAAHLVIDLQRLNGRWDDVSVNVGVLRAGTRTNIVCSEAELRIEVRAATDASFTTVRTAIGAIAADVQVPGTTVTVEQLDHCPPMEEGSGSRFMLMQATRIAASLGLRCGAVTTGGVGDANFLSSMGIPTLDGLGPVGGADHTPEEWLDVTTVPTRIALLASLTAALGDGRPPCG